MRKFDLYVIQRWTFVFSNVCLTQRSSCESYSKWSQKLLCPFEKSLQILAAQCPAIRNPTVVHLSQLPLHFCHHPSSAFYLFAPQPSSEETSTLCRITVVGLFETLTVSSSAEFDLFCSADSSIRILVDSLASKIHANLDLNSSVLLRVSPCLHVLLVLQGIAGAIGVSNFLRAFLMVSLNSLSSGSMK